ncbi:MAG: type II secretion system minor pseudopilin GspK [Halofilum sp. (in: g-proteobacteria)]|nr:type II secretion system minor pseudopilin GspK [Halofilum sp. (in: g-proteobacteria)]
MRGPTSQRGTALVTALLVLAMTVTLTADMAGDQHFDIRRTGNLLQLEQAHQIALGGERWAVAILARDRRGESAPGQDPINAEDSGADIDSLDEDWAQPLPPIPVEGGQIAGEVVDLQGRFNVNNLVVDGAVDALALARFERLLAALEIEPGVAQAVVDWLDADSETTFPDGAEDDFYLSREQPYLAANRPLATVSELRQVRGMEAEPWRRLRPHVTALPDPVDINVNTASAAVLQALAPDLDAGTAEQLAARAREEPFESSQQFLEEDVLADRDIEAAGLAVRSSHFRLRAAVLLGRIEYTLYSWLQRDDNGASRVLRRARHAD